MNLTAKDLSIYNEFFEELKYLIFETRPTSILNFDQNEVEIKLKAILNTTRTFMKELIKNKQYHYAMIHEIIMKFLVLIVENVLKRTIMVQQNI